VCVIDIKTRAVRRIVRERGLTEKDLNRSWLGNAGEVSRRVCMGTPWPVRLRSADD